VRLLGRKLARVERALAASSATEALRADQSCFMRGEDAQQTNPDSQ